MIAFPWVAVFLVCCRFSLSGLTAACAAPLCVPATPGLRSDAGGQDQGDLLNSVTDHLKEGVRWPGGRQFDIRAGQERTLRDVPQAPGGGQRVWTTRCTYQVLGGGSGSLAAAWRRRVRQLADGIWGPSQEAVARRRPAARVGAARPLPRAAAAGCAAAGDNASSALTR